MSKIKSLTPKQVIMAMVDGLKNPKTEINMDTYGAVVDGVCFGCAATNAICQIFAIDDPKTYLLDGAGSGFSSSAYRLSENRNDVDNFEAAIDRLRVSYVEEANYFLDILGMALIKEAPHINLPWLDSDYTLEDLEPYIALAEYQDQ